MKRKTGIFLIIGVLVLILLTGCGTGTEETASEDSKEADKLQIGLSDGCVTAICLYRQHRGWGQK